MIAHRDASACFQLLAANIQEAVLRKELRKEEQLKDEVDSILRQAGFTDIKWAEDLREIRCEGRNSQDQGRRTTFIYEKAI